MEQDKEKRFYEELALVPDVPAHILGDVERRVKVSGTKRRLALAACLMLAFIIPAVMTNFSNSHTAHAEEHESVEELFYALEFLTGGSDAGISNCLFDAAVADKFDVSPERDGAAVGARRVSAANAMNWSGHIAPQEGAAE